MFSNSLFSNEGIPEWMTVVVMIMLFAGYAYYKHSLKKSGKEENSNIWSQNSTVSGLKNNNDQQQLEEKEDQ